MPIPALAAKGQRVNPDVAYDAWNALVGAGTPRDGWSFGLKFRGDLISYNGYL